MVEGYCGTCGQLIAFDKFVNTHAQTCKASFWWTGRTWPGAKTINTINYWNTREGLAQSEED